MTSYEQLNMIEKECIERAIDSLRDALNICTGQKLANDDRAARAAESLACYILESRKK